MQIVGTMACESLRRQTSYLKTGCNAFHKTIPTSQPMSFWTESDVLEYLYTYQIPYASVYGDIVKTDGGGGQQQENIALVVCFVLLVPTWKKLQTVFSV